MKLFASFARNSPTRKLHWRKYRKAWRRSGRRANGNGGNLCRNWSARSSRHSRGLRPGPEIDPIYAEWRRGSRSARGPHGEDDVVKTFTKDRISTVRKI